MDCAEALKLVDIYLDRELDSRSVPEFERHAAQCAECGRALETAKTLKHALRNEQLYKQAPGDLRARILSALPKETKAISLMKYRLSMSWLSYGLSMASVAAISLALALQLGGPSPDDRLDAEIMSSHINSLMAEHLTDVASTDQHTVKPWFNGKLDYSPPVADHRDQGFALVGGRLDYIGHRPVSTLVYRHNKHIINVYIWPDAHSAKTQTVSRDGYNFIKTYKSGMVFWVASDLNMQELQTFTNLL